MTFNGAFEPKAFSDSVGIQVLLEHFIMNYIGAVHDKLCYFSMLKTVFLKNKTEGLGKSQQ